MVRGYSRLAFSTKHRRPFLRDKTLPEATHVADQEEHHRTMSFQDGLRALLRKHHVEWVGKIPPGLMPQQRWGWDHLIDSFPG